MIKNPLVSIIMNCHNGQIFLEESLKSIFSQSYENWELIFWDNKSNDKSKKILNNFKDKRIKYFYSNEFNTLYKSRNLAVKKATGKFITFLDTDDIWNKKKLEKQISFVKKNNVKICCTNIEILNHRNKKRKNFIKNNKEITTQKLLNRYDLGISTIMIEKKLINKILFNTKYEIIGDFDLFVNLSLKYKIGYLDEVLATYRLHEKSLSYQRIDLHIRELRSWIKYHEIKFKKNNFNFKYQKFYLLKLMIKKSLKFF